MIYLIDYENVGSSGFEGLEQLSEEDLLYIFIRERDMFTAPLILNLHEFKGQYKFKQVDANSKNAVDFQLVAFSGIECSKKPKEKFFIVSRDKGFDSAVKLLTESGFDVSRIEKLG